MYPTGIIKNTSTGRFHPILFRPAPFPGGADENNEGHRYQSLGHHTEGFDSIENAQKWICEQGKKVRYIEDLLLEWDGVGIPAISVFLSIVM